MVANAFAVRPASCQHSLRGSLCCSPARHDRRGPCSCAAAAWAEVPLAAAACLPRRAGREAQQLVFPTPAPPAVKAWQPGRSEGGWCRGSVPGPHQAGPQAAPLAGAELDDSWGVAALDARDAPALFTLAEQLEQFAAMRAAQARSCGTPCLHSPALRASFPSKFVSFPARGKLADAGRPDRTASSTRWQTTHG